MTLLCALVRNSYRSGGTGAFSWDAPGVLPGAPGALPGRSWTHPGPQGRRILSSFRPKRHVGTPHMAKHVAKANAICKYLQGPHFSQAHLSQQRAVHALLEFAVPAVHDVLEHFAELAKARKVPEGLPREVGAS